MTVAILFTCCKKTTESTDNSNPINPVAGKVTDHVIFIGQHNSNKNEYRQINTAEMKFSVLFDSTAIYQTVAPLNQLDINKLYGFSDNNQDHHTNSARIGWRWYQNQLQLFAYIYNNTVESDRLITSVPLNQEINCSIKVSGSNYIITANGVQVTMPRASVTATAIGYQLYPYFGGDETAPHDIRIRIKDL